MDLIIALALVHFVLFLFFFILRIVSMKFSIVGLFTALVIPVFGPLSAIVVIFESFKERKVDYEANFEGLIGVKNSVYDYRQMTGDFVSAEEVFIVNSNSDRRKIMLDILRQDAKPYLDVLRLAVSNDDAETSHYATATIMQIQTDYQNEIAACFAKASEPEATEADFRRYIESLLRYINSKLLDENLLVRQRQALKGAIEIAVKRFHCMDYVADYIENLICMGETDLANRAIEPLLASQCPPENIMLLKIRLLIMAQDRKGLDAFLSSLKDRHITLTSEIQEEISFWEGREDRA